MLDKWLHIAAVTASDAAHHAGEAAKHAAEHGAEHAHAAEHAADHGTPHVVNWVSLLAHSIQNPELAVWLKRWEPAIFAVMIVAIFSFFVTIGVGKFRLIPGRGQALLEVIVEGLDGLTRSIMGPAGRAYSPYVGTLFLYILISNWFGLVPLQNSATAYLTTTAPLAICTFLYTQYTGIAKNGIGGYLFHLMGSPKSAPEYALVPLMMPLHIMGEFIKPVTLMLRLYGNMMAGHVLIAVFLQLGITIMKNFHIPVGLPLHLPFLFMEILVGAVQALVFSLLSAVYIAMMLPHEHEHEHGHADASHAGGQAHAAHHK